MSTNYSEQIFQSVDTIISQRLNEVSFDKTEICEIISIDKKTVGKYLVSNGSLKYEAYSDDENREYKVGTKVYVRINNGDYSLRKTITGSYTADEIPKNLYTNPFNYLVKSYKISIPLSDRSKPKWPKILATKSDEGTTVSSVNNIKVKYNTFGAFNYIGVDVALETLNFSWYQGNYGILFKFFNSNNNLLYENGIDSSNFYGNPYNFNSNLNFQFLLPAPKKLQEISKVETILYERGNFKQEDVDAEAQITIKKLDLYFGYDVELLEKDKIKLVLQENQSLEYTTGTNPRKLSISWAYCDEKTKDGIEYSKQFIFNPEQPYPGGKAILDHWEFSDKNYNIFWCKYKQGYEKQLTTMTDDSAFPANQGGDIKESGTYWKTLQYADARDYDTGANDRVPNAYEYEAKLDPDYQTQSYKVIIKEILKKPDNWDKDIKDEKTNKIIKKKMDSVEKQNYLDSAKYYESNTIEFKNKNKVIDPGKGPITDSLILTLGDGDDGVYNFYGQDFRKNTTDESKIKHTITVSYREGYDWNKYNQEILWKIPAVNTMIKKPEGWTQSTDKKYYTKTISKAPDGDKRNNTITFEVQDIYSPTKVNNTIYCEIVRNGQRFQGSISLRFGMQETNGSGYALNIVPSHNYGLASEKSITYTAVLEDNTGVSQKFDLTKLNWSWYYGDSSLAGLALNVNNTNKKATITRNSGVTAATKAKAILKCTLTGWVDLSGRTINLETYHSIGFGGSTTYMVGPSRIIYDSFRTNPQYDQSPYTLSSYTNKPYSVTIKDVEGNEIYKNVWADSNNDGVKEHTITQSSGEDRSNYPGFQKNSFILSPIKFLPTNPPPCYIAIKENKNDNYEGWWQPLLITTNVYSSDLVNQWDGNLTINNESNYILTQMIGAGTMNKSNQFTGVFMGTVGQKTGISGATTGIYGLNNGNQVFRLTERGSFYVGNGSDQYIAFNDSKTSTANTFKIVAKNFDLNTAKLKINSNGIKPVSNDAKNAVIWFGDNFGNADNIQTKFRLNTDGTAIIGGWTIEKDRMYKAPEKDNKGDITNAGTGLAASGYGGNPAFWAGYTGYGNNPWEHSSNRPKGDTSSWSSHTKCYITNNGILHASGAQIKGDFTISANSVVKDKNGNNQNVTQTLFEVIPGRITSAISESKEYADGKIGEVNTLIEQTANSIKLEANNYVDNKLTNYATLSVMNNKLAAKVSSSYTGSSFGWDLTSTEFSVYSGKSSNKVLQITKNGLTVTGSGTFTGKITANDGTIGAWNITSSYIDSKSGNKRFYLASASDSADYWIHATNSSGTRTFSVSKNGYLYANGATIKGDLQVGSTLGNGGILSKETESGESLRFQLSSNQAAFYISEYTSGTNRFYAYSSNSDGTQVTNSYLQLEADAYSKTFSNYKTYAKLRSNGYIYIGTYTPTIAEIDYYRGSIYLYANQSVTLHANNGYVYAGTGTGKNHKVKTDSGDYSSKNLKENIISFKQSDYISALKLLNKINLYTYDYKYDLIKNPKNQFGFLIDEIESIPEHKQFFKFNHEKASIDINNHIHLNPEEFKATDKYIDVANFDDVILSKYLLTVCKALQQEVEDLKQEIKEIKQNEI